MKTRELYDIASKNNEQSKTAFDSLLLNSKLNDKDIESYYFLGLCYKNGYGTAVDEDQAYEYFKRATLKDIESSSLNSIEISDSYLSSLLELADYNEKKASDPKHLSEAAYCLILAAKSAFTTDQ